MSTEAIPTSANIDNKRHGDINATCYIDDPYKAQGADSFVDKAICLDSAYKHYGKGRSKTPVLLGLDMNVERGTIYGLLGKIITNINTMSIISGLVNHGLGDTHCIAILLNFRET